MRYLLVALAVLLLVQIDVSAPSTALWIQDEPFHFTRGALFLNPGERISVRVAATEEYRLSAAAGSLERVATNQWYWSAPQEFGQNTELRVVDAAGQASFVLNAFTLVPFAQGDNDAIGDFIVGAYPDPAGIRSDLNYAPPRGFVKVTEANQDRHISPHLTLGQFLCKQEGGWPKYLVPSQTLLKQLEAIHDAVEERGIALDTLTIMSGYRTPYYNKSIGNVAFSRHIYGDAADIFVDADGDGTMDDLDRNGRIDRGDAETLALWIEALVDPQQNTLASGGIGIYGSTATHGPFVHVDVRGSEARWESH